MNKSIRRFKLKDTQGYILLQAADFEAMPLWWKTKFLDLFKETAVTDIPVVFED